MSDPDTGYQGTVYSPRAPEAGDVFRIGSFTTCAPFKRGFDWLRNFDAMHGSLLALAQEFGDERVIIGTAISIAPGIAISASHVFEEAALTRAAVTAFAPQSGGALDIWSIHELGFRNVIADDGHIGATHDVCLISLKYLSRVISSHAMSFPVLAPRALMVGETVFAVGFTADPSAFRSGEAKGLTGFVSAGQVTQVYNEGRDRVMLPNPCLEVDMQTVSGMSGGPVFNALGHLIGVVSSSVEGTESVSPTFVSLIWPAMITTVTAPWPQNMYQGPVSPNELISRGLLTTESGTVTVLPDGRPQLAYSPMPELPTYPAFPNCS